MGGSAVVSARRTDGHSISHPHSQRNSDFDSNADPAVANARATGDCHADIHSRPLANRDSDAHRLTRPSRHTFCNRNGYTDA